MSYLLILLVAIYFIVPSLLLAYTLRQIILTKSDPKAHLNAWLVDGLATFLVAFSFLPLLGVPSIDLRLTPVSGLSVLSIVLSFIITIGFLPTVVKIDRLIFFIGGVQAAFLEEILFRGVIFGLLLAATQQVVTALVLSSLLFGVWHLKNASWTGVKKTARQALYTGLIAGPIFCLVMLYSGDIYLSILAHLLHNIVLTFVLKGKN